MQRSMELQKNALNDVSRKHVLQTDSELKSALCVMWDAVPPLFSPSLWMTRGHTVEKKLPFRTKY